MQALGHYLSWFAQIGFRTDAFEQLQTEFSEGNNLLWGSSNSDHGGHVYDAMVAANALRPDGDTSSPTWIATVCTRSPPPPSTGRTTATT